MTTQELHNYIRKRHPKENESCEWKSFGNLKHVVSGKAGDDIISYVSAISNMNGGHLIIGVEDESLNIRGINDTHTYTPENFKNKLLTDCTNLSSEGLYIEEFLTSDTNSRIWIIHIPKHPFRETVIAHKQAWQRVGDSLIAMTNSRKEAILHETRESLHNAIAHQDYTWGARINVVEFEDDQNWD